ncbi:MAG: hypothetical protein A2902_03490 [Elusimicrobia bacterium RIFCSPLOWO2_01_FULL_64_13]|nr:MAG: hypothetical protein A2902_03490 [Elusimicrobia bacterium RIFCSPLOWO2_01_FULL_64_13]
MFNSNKDVKIIVVDDEPEILRTLQRALSRKGYGVVTFEDPFLALEHVRKEKVDLVLSDLKMPKMDGLQLLLQVKAARPGVPVIMLTGFATIEYAVTAMQQGAFDFLRKPFEIRNIYEVVQSALDSRKR